MCLCQAATEVHLCFPIFKVPKIADRQTSDAKSLCLYTDMTAHVLHALQDGQHRKRRRAVFTSGDANPAAPSDEGDDSEDEDQEDVGEDLEARQQSGSSAESSGQDESDAESDESEGE